MIFGSLLKAIQANLSVVDSMVDVLSNLISSQLWLYRQYNHTFILDELCMTHYCRSVVYSFFKCTTVHSRVPDYQYDFFKVLILAYE